MTTSPAAPTSPPPAARPRSSGARHRPDIQGLRAIAVLAVVAVHVGIGSVTGGFVGVDVFFAISGFLITQQLIRSVERDGRVSLLGFYARRARRILPAATLVLLATVLYASAFLGVVRTKEIITDAIWSAFFAANIRFAEQETDYFAADLPPSPLQHFWSLAVEEQFYLVWPVIVLIVVVTHRWLRGRGLSGPDGARRGLIVAVAALTVGSLIFSAILTQSDPAAAYFSPFTRAWELGLGALAALAIRDDGEQNATARWRAQALAAAGVFLIVAACLQFNDATPFPGTPALVPVLGSVFILVAGTLWHGPTVASRLLEAYPLQVLGNWSYSLYLWHFPLLVLPAIHAGRDIDWLEKTVLVLLAVALSGISYHYVEQPIRNRALGVPNARVVLMYPISVGLVIAMAFGGQALANQILTGGGYQPAISVAGADTEPSDGPSTGSSGPANQRPRTRDAPPAFDIPDGPTPALVKSSVQAARADQRVPSELNPAVDEISDSTAGVGQCDYLKDSRDLCARGDTDGDKTLVLFGDSHARHWIPAMEEITSQTGYKAYYLVRPQCLASMVTPDALGSDDPDTGCAEFHTWAVKQIKKIAPDLLVVSSSPGPGALHENGTRYTGDDYEQKASQGYRDLLKQIKPAAKKTVWMRDVPQLEDDVGPCLGDNGRLGACLFGLHDAHARRADQQLDAARSRNVPIVDITNYICWDGSCPPVVGSTVSYRDDEHLTNEYSASLAGPLGSELGLW